MVEVMAGCGIPQPEIALCVPSRTSGRPISHVTLRKHFRSELSAGIAKVKAKFAANLLRLSATNGAVAIFAAKTRLGFRETIRIEHSGKVSTTPNLTDDQINRRILQLQDKARARQPHPKRTA